MTLKPSSIKHVEDLADRLPALVDLRQPLISAAEMICECHNSGGKVLACGNGGSAADAEHIVGELMKSFILPRKLSQRDIDRLRDCGYDDWDSLAGNLQQGLCAISLNGHPALSSAILNDTDPYAAFAQQVYVCGRPGDVLIGLSTSGNSRNVVTALKVARAFGLKTVGFTGEGPCKMDDLCDVIIKAPESETFRVQEVHLPAYHTLCLVVEEELFGA